MMQQEVVGSLASAAIGIIIYPIVNEIVSRTLYWDVDWAFSVLEQIEEHKETWSNPFLLK